MGHIVSSFTHATRLLVRQPGLALAVVLTLTLGIGANTAVFSVVEAVLLRPLPYPTADRLVMLEHRDERTGLTKPNIAIGDFLDIRSRTTTLAQVVAYSPDRSVLYGEGEPLPVEVLSTTGGFSEAVGLRPILGRLLTAEDSRMTSPRVAVLSHALWVNVFKSDPNVLGRQIQVGTLQREVVGVAEPGFRFPPTSDRSSDIMAAWRMTDAPPASRRNGWPLVVGLLAPDAQVEQASAELQDLSKAFEVDFPSENTGTRYRAVPLRQALLGDTRTPLLLMLGAVGVVLLSACANVGNLLLARAMGRRQEMAVRAAMGAGRGRLLLQFFAEGLVLTIVAATCGLIVAFWGVPALVALIPSSVAVPGLEEVGLNTRVLLFTAGMSLLAAFAFSLVSVVSLRGTERDALTSHTRVVGQRGARRVADGLVVAEVAFAVLLMIGAGLVTRTMMNLLERDPGFDPEGVLTMSVGLPSTPGYQSVEAREAFYASLWPALRAVPGVIEAGSAAVTPLTGNNWTIPLRRIDRPDVAGQKPPDVGWQVASEGYFKALGIPLIDGRLFDSRDRPGSAPVVIVSSALAREYFPEGPAVGRRVRVGDNEAEIVGVVGDIRRASLTDEPRADMYLSAEQAPSMGTGLFIKVAGDPSAATAAVRDAVRQLEPRVAFANVSTLEATLQQSIASTRLAVWLLGLFAGVALLLSAVGVYGVMAYGVRQRTRELGTRVALGASRQDLVWMVLRQGIQTAAVGVALGLGAAWLAGRWLESLLFGVQPFDPATVGVSVVVIGVAALLACYVPAWRASRVDAARTLLV